MSIITPVKETDNPLDIGLSSDRFEALITFMQSWIDTDRTPSAAIGMARQGCLLVKGFGRMSPDEHGVPLPPDAIYLVASLTKPVTCAAIALLNERGLLELEAPVQSIIPEFKGSGKETVLINHLLTHTSGLPDMIPENMAYRKAFRPLKDFIARICTLELLFEPGTDISYQSTGIALLGEVVTRITGMSLPQFLRQEFFLPLGMNDTSLGNQHVDDDRIPIIRVPADQMQAEWHWNKNYWRALGAPWGGMFTTVRDMNIYLQMFLNEGCYNNTQILNASTVDAMTRNQTDEMPSISITAKQKGAWGLGWRMNYPLPAFGSDSPPSPRTFGHGGATGTMCWADPESGLSCALFTTQPEMHGSEEFNKCVDILVG